VNTTDVSRPGPRDRGRLLLTLLTSASLLAGGAQALAPTSAAAMVSEGEECDPGYPTPDCEPNGGGEGGGSSGSTEGSAGGDQIIGEAIYVEGTLPPSPCGIGCLPSQVGATRAGFLDRGGRDPRGPRPRGRLTRVGEAARPKGKPPTKTECERLNSGRLELPADLEMKAIEARLSSTNDRQAGQEEKLRLLQDEAARLAREVMSLQNSQAPSGKVLLAQERYQRALGSVAAMERELRGTMEEFFRLAREHEAWRAKRAVEARILQRRCAAVNRDA
jgi:hypothetical protein